MGGVNSGDPVLIFHEEFAGASSKSLAIVVLEIFVSESDGGRTLVAYSSTKLNKIVICKENVLYISNGNSLTWNNEINDAQIQSCLYTLRNFNHSILCSPVRVVNTAHLYYHSVYHIPVNISGEELNSFTCKAFNRKGHSVGSV